VFYYSFGLYICAIMKKILFYITIALAILLPNSFSAQGATSEFGFNITQHNDGFVAQQNSHDLIFDACVEDFSDDDDSNESERKKTSSAQTTLNSTFLLAQNHSENFLKKVLTAHLFFPRKTVLFILLCVFRL
jgi:hypothetical protein